jgi:hypothetical protein
MLKFSDLTNYHVLSNVTQRMYNIQFVLLKSQRFDRFIWSSSGVAKLHSFKSKDPYYISASCGIEVSFLYFKYTVNNATMIFKIKDT